MVGCFLGLLKKTTLPKGAKLKPNMKTNKTQPAHQLRSRSIKCAVWKNESANGSFYTQTLERLYKDGEVWKSSHSFGIGDTADIELVLTQAREWVAAQTKSEPVAA